MGVNRTLLIGQSIGFFILFALCLFVPAGTWNWVAGWVFLVLFFGFYVGVTAWLYRHNPSLVQERTRLGGSNQKGWDKILFTAILVLTFAWLVVMALDAVRFQWSHVSVALQIIGGVILLFSFYLLFLTFRENSYLSPVVRVQSDRGHSVVSTGPYHFVRHPMYAAILVFVIGTALLLGSWVGVVFGLFLMLLLARRAMLEESTLQQELDGYRAYMTSVKYRIIPYLW